MWEKIKNLFFRKRCKMEKSGNNQEADKKADILWQWLLHEDNLFTNRANFFLVAESFLFMAFATLCTSKYICLSFIIGLAGIVISVIWHHISSLQLNKTITPIKERLEKDESYIYIEWYKIAKKSEGKGLHKKLGIWLPQVFILSWGILLIFLLIMLNICVCFNKCCNVCRG